MIPTALRPSVGADPKLDKLIRLILLVLAAALLTAAPGAIAAGPTDRTFDYLYIEPNSGASSGGHAAVRFGDVTFHFQHAEPGIIRAVKETSESFEYVYRGLGNRTVHVSRIAVSADTYARLHDAFDRRHLVQQSQLELLESRRRDRQVLEFLRDAAAPGRAGEAPGGPGVELPGSAYFVVDAPADDVRGAAHAFAHGSPFPTPALELLREQVGYTHGNDYLTRRSDDLRAEIEALTVDVSPHRIPTFAPDLIPAARAGFSDRYGELLLAWLAVEVLRTGACPRATTLRTSEDPAFQLSDEEIHRLRTLAENLRTDVVRLLGSRRPDVGFPLLVGMARLAALERSAASGRLVVLDGFPEHPQELPSGTVRRYQHVLRAILAERRDEFARARVAIFASRDSGEATWSRLETAANLLLELEAAVEHGTPLRVYPGTPLPVKAVPLRASWPRPQLGRSALETGTAQARRIERDVEAQLVGLYPYHVVSRNCVTEIFRTLEAGLDPETGSAAADLAAARVRAEARSRLGGHVEMTGTANFIPIVAHRAVRDTYRVTARSRLPSYRRQRLARLVTRQSPLLVYLRESNTLTSTIQPTVHFGEPFLFFTEDAVAPRPLLGLVNLGIGAGASALGIVTLPFDRGRRLVAGARAALFSLPEMAFVNLRKGEIAILPQEWHAYDAGAQAQAPGRRRATGPVSRSRRARRSSP